MLRINSKLIKNFVINDILHNKTVSKYNSFNRYLSYLNFCNQSNKSLKDSPNFQDGNNPESKFENLLEKQNFCFTKNSLLSENQNQFDNINNNKISSNVHIQTSKTILNTSGINLRKQNMSTAEIQLDILDENQNTSPVMTLKNKLLERDFKSIKKEISELSKFKLCVLNTSVSLSSYAFYSTISHTTLDFFLFGSGTLFISMTTQVLNQIMEKKYDKQMKRTFMRPLPRERISDKEAWIISSIFWTASSLLYYATAPQAILFANGILLLYILGYTPLKRHSNLSMHIGAIVGALPALLGSYAATGIITLEHSMLLAAYIMAWQYPHFYGILYQNKDDYKKAGFKFISADSSKTYIAYIQMIVAMGLMLYITYRLYKNKILNEVTMGMFVVFFAMNMVPVLQFLNNPSGVAKKIRMKSYMPFLIVLISFFYNAGAKRYEDLKDQKANHNQKKIENC